MSTITQTYTYKKLYQTSNINTSNNITLEHKIQVQYKNKNKQKNFVLRVRYASILYIIHAHNNTVINKYIMKVTMMNGKSACTANWHVYTIWNLIIVIICNGSLHYTTAAMMFNFHIVVAL